MLLPLSFNKRLVFTDEAAGNDKGYQVTQSGFLPQRKKERKKGKRRVHFESLEFGWGGTGTTMNELARSSFVGPGDVEGHHGQILDLQQLWFGEVFGSACPESKF